MPNKRPEAVTDIAFWFGCGGGCLVIFIILLIPFMILPSKLDTFVIGLMVLIPLSIFSIWLLILSFGLYKLRPWAYTASKELIESEHRLRMLRKKIQDPEVQRAFGAESDATRVEKDLSRESK